MAKFRILDAGPDSAVLLVTRDNGTTFGFTVAVAATSPQDALTKVTAAALARATADAANPKTLNLDAALRGHTGADIDLGPVPIVVP